MKQHSRRIEPDARHGLQQLAQRRSSALVVWRARIVLAVFEGAGYRQISQRFRCSQAIVARWVKRFRTQGVAGLQSRPRALKRFGYSWKRAKRTRRCLAPYGQRIRLVFLPTYSPWLSRIEDTWRIVKAHAATNTWRCWRCPWMQCA